MGNGISLEPGDEPSGNGARPGGPVPGATGSYIQRHWRGELSLARSFWLNFIGVVVAFNVAVTVLGTLAESGMAMTMAVAALILLMVEFTLLPWQVVGCWRAANRYTDETGSPITPILAKILLVANALMATAALIGLFASL